MNSDGNTAGDTHAAVGTRPLIGPLQHGQACHPLHKHAEDTDLGNQIPGNEPCL